MIKWRIDKSNKIPLYLQLKDLIKFYISTGVLGENERLPGVNELGRHLDVNFETVRKAYKELEEEHLVSMERGRGSYVTLHGSRDPSDAFSGEGDPVPGTALKSQIRLLLNAGIPTDQVVRMVDETVREVEEESASPVVLFTECNRCQVQELSSRLADYLDLEVVPVMLSELENRLSGPEEDLKRIRAVVTTGFHLSDVRTKLAGRGIPAYPLITNMSPATRQAIQDCPPDAHFGFICRDSDSLGFCEDLIRAELGRNIRLTTSIFENEKRVTEILDSVDILLVSPPVFQDLSERSSSGLPVYNVFDQIDPMSMRLIKDRIFSSI